MTVQLKPLETTQISSGLNLAMEVKAAMARFDLRQADLAKVLGITQSSASRKLKGHTPFTFDELDVLADWFSTTPQVLMGFALEPRPQNPASKKFLTVDTARNSDSYTARDSNPEPIDYESENEVAWQNLAVACLIIVSVASRVRNQQTI
jgi:transcriptional regulator with XRE-family HTH domain